MFRKLINTNRKTEILYSALDTYIVEWESITGSYSWDKKTSFQAFASKQDAILFKMSLDQANTLLGNKNREVKMYKQESGLGKEREC